jgi:hypothetical protein
MGSLSQSCTLGKHYAYNVWGYSVFEVKRVDSHFQLKKTMFKMLTVFPSISQQKAEVGFTPRSTPPCPWYLSDFIYKTWTTMAACHLHVGGNRRCLNETLERNFYMETNYLILSFCLTFQNFLNGNVYIILVVSIICEIIKITICVFTCRKCKDTNKLFFNILKNIYAPFYYL